MVDPGLSSSYQFPEGCLGLAQGPQQAAIDHHIEVLCGEGWGDSVANGEGIAKSGVRADEASNMACEASMAVTRWPSSAAI